MVETFQQESGSGGTSGTSISTVVPPRLPVIAFGLSLSLFLAVSFILCVLFDLWFPEMAMYPAWGKFLPGFTWLTWPSFFLGLVESIAYGWYVALIFAPLFNYFASRLGR